MQHTQPAGMPPQAVLVQMAIGAWNAKVLSAVTSLDIADILHQHGPATAVELVQRHGVDANPAALERCLRVCAALGIFSEDSEGRFGPTSISEPLTLNSPVSVKKMIESFVGNSMWIGLAGLPKSIRTGKPHVREHLGRDWWDYLNANPEELELFGEAMKSNSISSIQGVLNHCDFSASKKIADIGGGFGHLAVALLEKYPHLNAAVLDVPELIPIAKQRMQSKDSSVWSRLEYLGGDMFQSVPPADVYIFKHIMHDWDDEHCLAVLRNCHRELHGNGRIICIDSVVPPMGDTSGANAKVTDIMMMTFIAGKERTKPQWDSLYREAGFRISSIIPLADNVGTSIVEGVKSET